MQKIIKNLKIKRRLITQLAAMHFYGNPSATMRVVGVTGTNGKTTTTTLLYKIATALGYKCGLIGTVENMIAGERYPSTHTTPGPVALHRLLAEMKEKGCEYVFMEVSSHAADQKRIAGIRFVGGVFTNLTHDHLDYHKSFENYFYAKRKFFEYLPTGSFALSNADDEHGRAIIQGIKAREFFYGFSHSQSMDKMENEDFHGEIQKMDFAGIDMDIHGTKIHTKLLGQFNAYNILSVWGACKLLDFDMPKVNKILETIEPPRGRFDHFMSERGVLGIVDYAHTPDAMEKVLLTIRGIKPLEGRLITVAGCGGDRDPLKRRAMGKIAAVNSDIAIFTADNPRSEDPEKIIAEMKTDLGMTDAKKVQSITNRREAIREAAKLAQPGDIIAVLGKGHEDYQEIRGVKHHFNDMEELKKALK